MIAIKIEALSLVPSNKGFNLDESVTYGVPTRSVPG